MSRAAPITAMPGVTAGINDVTGVTTQVTNTGAPTSAGVITGGSVDPTSSPFATSNSYNVVYNNNIDAVTGITAGGATYKAIGTANDVVRRSVGVPSDAVWSVGTQTGYASGSTVTLDGPYPGPTGHAGYPEVFAQNAINFGGDNLFSTRSSGGNPVGNNTNVDRVDMLFTGGLTTSAGTAFFVTDRGVAGDHDAFAVAAILSLDSTGAPATYGPLLQFADGSWGNTNLTPTQEEVVLRTDDTNPADPLHPSDSTVQTVGGVAITTAGLAGGAGQKIYGYSLFTPALTVTGDGSGTQLAAWTNTGVYGQADFTTAGGGLDPAATLSVLFQTTTVPEPTTAAVAALAIGGLLAGRRRRNVSIA